MPEKRKIAILGGGIGALTTAFELTRSPNWKDNFDITVYQMGWRLGGKGASGRDLEQGSRIEEHGLHIWFGFYENAFEVMRLAYEEVNRLGLTPGSPFTDFTRAFTKQNICSMVDPDGTPGDDIWSFWFPPTSELPGTGLDQQVFRTPWDDIVGLLHWLLRHWEEAATLGVLPKKGQSFLQRFLYWLGSLFGFWKRQLLGLPLHLAAMYAKKLPRDPHRHSPEELSFLLKAIDDAVKMVERLIQQAVKHQTLLRRLFIVADAVAATIRGFIKDGVLLRGYDTINSHDLKEWLESHGCLNAGIATRPAYDACFAFKDGDFSKPSLEAGTALRGAMRAVLTYRGAALWRMNAGMGDTVFSPLYLLLKKRGVKFEFFHRVENLGLSQDRKKIETIDFDVQATVKDEVMARQGGYCPVVTVAGIPCWPNQPFYDQLNQGEEMKTAVDIESAWTDWRSGIQTKRLKRGDQFDEVVLGISLGGLPFICKELITANPHWRDMIQHVRTVPTQSVQLWLNKTATEMGYSNQLLKLPILRLAADEPACLSGYVEPFDTYADMHQVLDKETWPASAQVRQTAYFCNVLPEVEEAPFTDHQFPARQHERVKQAALNFFQKYMAPIWPDGLNAAGELDWDLLHDPNNRAGHARLDAQYFRANLDPSARYVLSIPDSSTHRLHPAKSGFENLVLAGDWTFNYVNAGCVEAAVISGRLASRALCGFPKTIAWVYGAELTP